MLMVDCDEFQTHMLGLGAYLSDAIGGNAIPLLRKKDIVFDTLSEKSVTVQEIRRAVEGYLEREGIQKDFTVEESNDTVTIVSVDREKAKNHPKTRVEPAIPGMRICPFCGLGLASEEMFVIHYRSHGAGY
jgi:hypothetical protein